MAIGHVVPLSQLRYSDSNLARRNKTYKLVYLRIIQKDEYEYEYNFIQTIDEYGEFKQDWKGLNRSPYTGKCNDDNQQHNGGSM